MSTPANDDEEPEELGHGLLAVGRFARLVRSLPWFARVGDELDAGDLDNARAYLEALGFPDAEVADVANWLDAEVAAHNPDWNPEWWEAEEQLRMALLDEASAQHGVRRWSVAIGHGVFVVR